MSAQKALQGSETETRELLGGTKVKSVSRNVLSSPPSYFIACDFPGMKCSMSFVPLKSLLKQPPSIVLARLRGMAETLNLTHKLHNSIFTAEICEGTFFETENETITKS